MLSYEKVIKLFVEVSYKKLYNRLIYFYIVFIFYYDYRYVKNIINIIYYVKFNIYMRFVFVEQSI